MAQVYIKITDRNWIIEKLASEISQRLSYVEYGTSDPLTEPAICYYMTYSALRGNPAGRSSMAFFTHLEDEPAARRLFLDTAQKVDHCVCMSRPYHEYLNEHGVSDVTTITPGVDFDQYEAKLRVGIVGRTYHTGRKGEALVDQLRDLPGIDWHVTGSGWPVPGRFVAHDDMADFYRSIDYLLVPAVYEGGPMPLLEALACGTPVIAPAVGFVGEFPHIPYENQDAESLQRVLLELLEKKLALRSSVAECTWDRWAERHDALFVRLGATRQTTRPRQAAGRVGLVLHGSESTTLGGPSVRVPTTVDYLKDRGFDAHLFPAGAGHQLPASLEVAHVFNVWSPDSALDRLQLAKHRADRLVFSPIYLNLAELEGYQHWLPKLAANAADRAELNAALTWLQAQKLLGPDAIAENREPVPGYFGRIRRMLSLADHVICLSEREQKWLEALGLDPARSSIVRNPVEADRFTGADPELFRQHQQLDRYILCVGRIEPRKNQLLLALAARELDAVLVLIGHPGDPDYMAQVLRWGGENVRHIARLAPADPLLASAFVGASCFALPSFAEGAPLAALEAAASGVPLLVSDRSGEREYFADLAEYCDPASVASIANGLRTCMSRSVSRAQAERIADQYSWASYIDGTAKAYELALAAIPAASDQAIAGEPTATACSEDLWIDLTTWVHAGSRRVTGINRTEVELATRLRRLRDCRFLCWISADVGFVEVEVDQDLATAVASLRARATLNLDWPSLDLAAGASLLVAGSAWMQNRVYTGELARLARRAKLRLSVVVFDLIPVKFPQWYEAGYTDVFESNFRSLCESASRLLCISRSTANDLQRLLDLDDDPRVTTIELGADFADGPGEPAPDFSLSRPYVLVVGSAHPRKNYQLLYNVWCELLATDSAGLPDLVMVGGWGWKSDELQGLVEGTPELKGRWHVLTDVSDAALAGLYDDCLFTVYPSLYEGWGLPVAESLSRGKVCLASNRASIPEIAPELVISLDPHDTPAWVTKITCYARNTAFRTALEHRIADQYRPTPWAGCAEEVIEKLPPTRAARPTSLRVYGGDELQFSQPQSRRVLLDGWGQSEADGVYSTAPEAGLAWQLDGSEPEAMVIGLDYSAYVPRAQLPLRVRVFCGEALVDRWVVGTGDRVERQLWLPAGSRGLRFEIENPRSPYLVSGKNDFRQLGLKLHRISFHRTPGDAAAGLSRHRRLGGDLLRPRLDGLTIPRGATLTPGWGLHLIPSGFAEILLPADGQDQRLLLRLRRARPELPLQVFANGDVVASVSDEGEEVIELPVDISADLIARRQPLRLTAVLAVPESEVEADGPSLGLLSVVRMGWVLPHLQQQTSEEDRSEPDAEPAADREDDQGTTLAQTLLDGWHEPEPDGVWSAGLSSTLRCPASLFARGGILALRCRPLPGHALPSADELSDFPVVGGGWVAEPDCWCVRLMLDPGNETVTLRLGLPQSPAAAGISEDDRLVGSQLCDVQAAPAGEHGAWELLEGWHPPEPAGVWSCAEECSLVVWNDRPEPSAVRVAASIEWLGDAKRPLEIIANGTRVFHDDIGSRAAARMEFEISAAAIGQAPGVVLLLRSEEPKSPRELGISIDGRPLGILLKSMHVDQS
ncbi:MAG: glycosyltransferase [Pseudomonadota bacterium]